MSELLPVLLVDGPRQGKILLDSSFPVHLRVAIPGERVVHHYERVRPVDETALFRRDLHALYRYNRSESMD